MNRVSEARLDALVEGEPAVSYDELRFVETITALRGSRPASPKALRDRVRAIGAEPRRSWLPLPWRGVALAAAPVAAALGLAVAVVHGVFFSGSRTAQQAATVEGQALSRAGQKAASTGRVIPFSNPAAPSAAHQAIPANPSRLQAYDAYLRLRVQGTDDLARATRRAMNVARSLGGYVAFVNLDTARQGDASLRLRVPIGSVQTAIGRLSGLGSIVAQSFTITDLQRQANQQLDAIAAAEGRVGRLALLLRDRSLSPERRARLELALTRAQQELRSLRGQHEATVRQAKLSTISVAFTTRSTTAPVAPARHGRIHRALSDAGSVLTRELAWLLYLAIVLAPLAVVAAALVALVRLARRRSERIVLEQP